MTDRYVVGLDLAHGSDRTVQTVFDGKGRIVEQTDVRGCEVQLLDHGYLKVIDVMGSDERIIEAARMSTQKGFLGWGDGEKPGDEKLLKFLWDNAHATPFEFGQIVVEVRAPLIVFREWHRHRTQCLVGDTMIACVSPRGTTYQRSIKSIFDLKYGGVEDAHPLTKNGKSRVGTPVMREARRKVPWRKRVLPNCQGRTLRVLNEITGEFETALMADVWESGVKEVFTITTITGRTIRASAQHPFFTREGWRKLGGLKPGDQLARLGAVAANERPIPPSLRRGIGVWTSMMRSRLIRVPTDACYLCGTEFKFSLLELDHVVPVFADLLRALDEKNLRPICTRCHKNKSAAEQPTRTGMLRRGVRWETVSKIEPSGEEQTYDIGVEGVHHNFVANGLVVHNSYNEASARYAPLPALDYLPTVERLVARGGKNKQAGSVGEKVADHVSAEWFRNALASVQMQAESVYRQALDCGIPKELARLSMTVGRYSTMRASANVRNWLAFERLRMAPGAQYEIRVYAEAMGDMIKLAFPRTWELFQASAK